MNFDDQVVLISDVTQSAGRATALMLAERGACLALGYPERPEAAQEVVAECERRGRAGNAFAAPLGRSEGVGVDALVEEAVGRWGSLHALIICAYIAPGVPFDDLSLAQWSATLEAGLHAPFYITKAALRPMMRQRYGRIVHIASLYGLAGGIEQADYAAAMGGLFGMARAAARELAPWSITVNAVAPGLVEGPELAAMDPAFVAWGEATVALRRAGRADEIAGAVCFLASSHASYITGQVLAVDGGWRIA